MKKIFICIFIFLLLVSCSSKYNEPIGRYRSVLLAKEDGALFIPIPYECLEFVMEPSLSSKRINDSTIVFTYFDGNLYFKPGSDAYYRLYEIEIFQ